MTHRVTRRDFLKVGAAGAACAVLTGCQNPRRWVTLEPYVRPPEEQLAGVANWYASTCRQCPAGCGILVRIMNGRALKIEGNPEHPLNQGKLCARGQAGLQVLYNPDRLSGPIRQSERGSRRFERLSWDEALNTLYDTVHEAGGRVVVWEGSTTSGHLCDLFQRFTDAVAAPSPILFDLYTGLNGHPLLRNVHRELFSSDELPTYDLGQADVVLSFSGDFLGTGLSSVRYGRAFGEFRDRPLGKRGYLVQLEPRMSITGAVADSWIPIRPGSESSIAQALARIIADQALGPVDRVERARTLAGDVDVPSVASLSDVSLEELERLASIFATAESPLAIPGSTVTGVDDAAGSIAAVQALNIIAGVAGRAGGLLSSQGSPLVDLPTPKISTIGDVATVIEQMKGGEVQVLLVHNANPAYDLPPKLGFLEALKQVPHVVSFSPVVDETSVWADLILPDRTYLESWGYEVVSPSFDVPILSSQQPVVAPVFDARSTADILLTIARGIPAAAQALPWTDEVAFLKETIGQLPLGAAGGSGSEVLWARFLQHGGWWPASPSPPVALTSTLSQPMKVVPPSFQGDEQKYPYLLHLYMSDLLSDGRGASQPWLQGSPDPMTTLSWQSWVELHPSTAQELGVSDGDVVRVSSPHGAVEVPVYVYPAIRPDTVAIPIGQGHSDCGRYARDHGINPMLLVGAETDSTDSVLAWANLHVQVERTEKRVALATFENKVGVSEGFLNQALPGG
jgi:anaerobic selenocysteine-containing dehydrogenase